MPCLRATETETAFGAWIESHTDVGGVLVRLMFTLAVGVTERLGYTVLARESGRGGEDIACTAPSFVDRVALYCSWATRASSAATWSRNLFSRAYALLALATPTDDKRNTYHRKPLLGSLRAGVFLRDLCRTTFGILKRRLRLCERGLALVRALLPFGRARLLLFVALL